jgi:hypothetical protein
MNHIVEMRKNSIKEGLDETPTVSPPGEETNTSQINYTIINEKIEWTGSSTDNIKQIEIKLVTNPSKGDEPDESASRTSDIQFKRIRMIDTDNKKIPIGPTIENAKLKYVTYSSNTNITSSGSNKIFEKWSNDGHTSIPITKINGLIIDFNPSINLRGFSLVMSTTSIVNTAVILLKNTSLNTIATINWHSENNDNKVRYHK